MRYNYNKLKLDCFRRKRHYKGNKRIEKTLGTILTAIKLLGGLAIFLYGMEIMGDSLKQGAGAVLKNFLGKLPQNALMCGHRYLQELHESGDRSYLDELEGRRKQYLVLLEGI